MKIAVDCNPEGSHSAIARATLDGDVVDVEIVAYRSGAGWVPVALGELECGTVLLDGSGPAAALIGPLAKANLDVRVLTAAEVRQAHQLFRDLVAEGRLRHHSQPELDAAIAGAARRSYGDSWSLSRRNSTVDICPLVAASLAAWAAVTEPKPVEPWAVYE